MLAALFWGLRYCHRQYAQRRVYVLPPTAVARIRRAFLGVALLPQAIRATARLCAHCVARIRRAFAVHLNYAL